MQRENKEASIQLCLLNPFSSISHLQTTQNVKNYINKCVICFSVKRGIHGKFSWLYSLRMGETVWTHHGQHNIESLFEVILYTLGPLSYYI